MKQTAKQTSRFAWRFIFVPIGFLLAFAVRIPPIWVFVFLSLDEFTKMPLAYAHYRKKKWLRNITRDIEPAG